jgi:hypothetical protein
MFVISDVGAAFGATGYRFYASRSDVRSYERSDFVTKVTPQYVNLQSPSRPTLLTVFAFPYFIKRLQMRWIGRNIPREDARWIGQLLGELTQRQIRRAFEGAGYSPAETERFARVVEARITQLREL